LLIGAAYRRRVDSG